MPGNVSRTITHEIGFSGFRFSSRMTSTNPKTEMAYNTNSVRPTTVCNDISSMEHSVEGIKIGLWSVKCKFGDDLTIPYFCGRQKRRA